MKIFLSVCILFSLNFCSKKNRVTYWELSKFRLEPAALSDNDHVKILYFSNGQESTSEYYYHALCVSETTGDTVNILMPIPNGIDQSSAREGI